LRLRATSASVHQTLQAPRDHKGITGNDSAGSKSGNDHLGSIRSICFLLFRRDELLPIHARMKQQKSRDHQWESTRRQKIIFSFLGVIFGHCRWTK
jgi:hypothetical protein